MTDQEEQSSHWDEVLLAWLHDPPDKALSIRGHVPRARDNAKCCARRRRREQKTDRGECDGSRYAGGRRLAGEFSIVFPQPVAGPIALGHSSRFGMGSFVPQTDDAAIGGDSC